MDSGYPVVRRERFGAFGVPIFPIYSLFDGEPRSYLEFPNHLVDNNHDGYIYIYRHHIQYPFMMIPVNKDGYTNDTE